MRRVTKGVALGAVLAMGFGLSACGGSDDGGDSGSASGSLLIWADEKRAGPIGDLAKSWGEENGVNVEVVQINFDDMKDQFAQQAPAGQGPDILLGASDWSGDFTKSGLIAPIDLGDNRAQFNPAAVDVFTIDGQTYGLPIATENILMFRNTNLAPDAPATINEMAAKGLELQSAGKTQYPIGIAVGDKGNSYNSYPMLSAAGGYFFGGPDAEGNYDTTDIGLASEGGLVFAKAWGDLGKQGAIKSTFEDADLQSAWSAGTLPYWITGPWNSELVKESGIPFAAEGIPGWEGVDDEPKPIVGAQGFMLNQNSTNPSTAQAFLDATMNTDFMDGIFAADPRPPAWNDSAEKAKDDEIIAAVLKIGENGYPNLPSLGIMYEEAGLAQKKILDGADPVATTEEAAANVAARMGTS